MSAPFKPYTSLQEMFDISAAHLLAQGRRAQGNKVSTCMYRAPDGCKCAVGVLIPDDLYDPSLEGTTAGSVLATLQDKLTPLWSDPNAGMLLTRLQNMHDMRTPDLWRDRLRLIANQHDLNTEVLS